MLRGHSFSFPEAPDGVMHDLFPQLMILMLEEDDSGPSCPVDDDGGHPSRLVVASRLLLCCQFMANGERAQSPPALWDHPLAPGELCSSKVFFGGWTCRRVDSRD